MSWKLSQLILSNGETINFNYKGVDYKLTSLEDISSCGWIDEQDNKFNRLVLHGGWSTSGSQPSEGECESPVLSEALSGPILNREFTTAYRSQYLSSITSNKYTVSFTHSNETKPKLEYVDFYENSNPSVKKRYRLFYEAYKHSGKGWNKNDRGIIVGDYGLYVKYKLKSLTECLVQNNIETRHPSHTFEYIEDIGLPSIISRAQDYWGYFNGQTNSSLICDESEMYATPYQVNIPANFLTRIKKNSTGKRFVDIDYLMQGALRKITYPTGGHTLFNFEPHEFKVKEGHILTKDEYLRGKSNYTGNIWQDSQGAGLRIASIVNYDSDERFIEKTRYGYRGGNHISALTFWIIEHTGVCGGLYKKQTGYAHNTSIGRQHENEVTYSNVDIIKSNDERDNSSINNGFTSYSFRNNPIIYIKTAMSAPLYQQHDYSNGLISAVKEYDSNSNMKLEKQYSHSIVSSGEFVCVRARNLWACPDGIKPFCRAEYEIGYNSYWLSYYPLNNEVWKCHLIDETIYENGEAFKTTTKYEYSKDKYFQLKSTTVTSSTGEKYTTKYNYSTDINTGVYLQMKNRNIISNPIEQVSLVDDKIIGASLITYRSNSNNFVKDKVFSLGTTTPLSSFSQFNGTTKDSRYNTWVDISFDNYDSKGNILQITGKDGINTSFLWDSSNTHLMAEVVGGTYSQINNQNGKIHSYDSKTLWNALILLLPSSFINTYSYKSFGNISNATTPMGTTSHYEYDNLGRLSQVKNTDGKVINAYEYKYRTN